MLRIIACIAIALPFAFGAAVAQDKNIGPNDWPWWRGPQRNGHADANQKPPLKWSENRERFLEGARSPAAGMARPSSLAIRFSWRPPTRRTTSVGPVLRSQDRRRQMADGNPSRRLRQERQREGIIASSTLACDGERVFINFLHNKAIYTTALSRDGKRLWQTKITDYVLHQGFGSSPAVYESLVIVSADNKGTGVIAGLDRATGKVVWKQRTAQDAQLRLADHPQRRRPEQLFFIGCDLVTSLEPLTGKQDLGDQGLDHRMRHLDRHRRPAHLHQRRLSQGPRRRRSRGWLRQGRLGERHQGLRAVVDRTQWHLYAVHGRRRGHVLEMRHRQGNLEGTRSAGNFSASPVLVGDLLFATNERAGRSFSRRIPRNSNWSPRTSSATR